MPMNKCVVFDIDATLADVSSLGHLITTENGFREALPGYHEAAALVPPHREIAVVAKALIPVVPVVVMTARHEKFRDITLPWLHEHIGYDFHGLMMADRSDYSHILKREMLENLRGMHYNPVLAYEDDEETALMFEAEGIPTVRGPGWDSPIVSVYEKVGR